MTAQMSTPTILLIPGHWLGAWAWDDVTTKLTAAGRAVVALTLPGLDPSDAHRMTRTIDDQAAAIRDAAAVHPGSCVIVAHSGANAPVSVLLDRYPHLVSHVIWVDSGPAADGAAFAPDLPHDVDSLPLPPFEELGGQASLDGLSDVMLERFRDRALAEPATVLRELLHLTNDARFSVPTTFVCCSMPSEQIVELAGAGHPMFADVARLDTASFVDLPTGHWPMWSRPDDLAAVIGEVAGRA